MARSYPGCSTTLWRQKTRSNNVWHGQLFPEPDDQPAARSGAATRRQLAQVPAKSKAKKQQQATPKQGPPKPKPAAAQVMSKTAVASQHAQPISPQPLTAAAVVGRTTNPWGIRPTALEH
eukprot:TRINITY_DN4756_c0_g4_i1.p1 TRINITY_DN4756_c0_g4~~TRINITY_DN4756_c0_g4_i1.p1  ORF type:complete len:120 (+),score=15.74 TRINITY_DN4756_c0_g4_i1:40-399(+)